LTATLHFIERVRQRIGPQHDAIAISRTIIEGIRLERPDMAEFVARVSRDGKRIFRFRVPDKGVFYALVDTANMTCVTVLPPGFAVNRQGKSRLKLKEIDW
jgi:hypothetical protein